MLKDQINLNFSLLGLRVRCFACGERGHLVNHCNLLHFKPDKEKIIKSNDFSKIQERASYNRKIYKSPNLKIIKNTVSSYFFKKIEDESPICEENSSDDGEIEEENKFKTATSKDYDIKMDSPSEKNRKSVVSFTPNLISHDNNAKIPNSLQMLNSTNLQITASPTQITFQMPMKRNSAQMVDEIRRGSLQMIDHVKRRSRLGDTNQTILVNNEKMGIPPKRVSFNNNNNIISTINNNIIDSKTAYNYYPTNNNTSYSTINRNYTSIYTTNVPYNNTDTSTSNVMMDSKRKNDNQEAMINLDLKASMEGFDAVAHMKKYFPHNNFDAIKKPLNKRKASICKSFAKKKKKIEKLSQYMFSAEVVQKKLDKMRKKAQNSKNLEKNTEGNGEQSKTLMGLVSEVVKNMKKDYNFRKKWYFPIWKMIVGKRKLISHKVKK